MSEQTTAVDEAVQAGDDEREAVDAEASEQRAPVQPAPPPPQQRALQVRDRELEALKRRIDALEDNSPIPFEFENMGQMFRLATQLAKSDIVPPALRGKPANAFLVLLRGRELELSPTQSLGAINVIDGKVADSAQLMIALVLRSPACEYFYCEEADELGATWVCRRTNWPEGVEKRASFTIEDAKRAGLYDKGATPAKAANNNWKKWPEEMCSWRAASKLAKRHFPEVTLGMDAAEAHELAENAIDASYTVRASAPPAGVQAPPPPAASDDDVDELAAEIRRLESEIELAASMDEIRRLHEDVKKLPKSDQTKLVRLMGVRAETLAEAEQGGVA